MEIPAGWFRTSAGKVITVATIAALVGTSGCASPPKMNAAAPIEKRSVFIGTIYEQNGEVIDPGDMRDKLETEPQASEELSGYGTLATIGIIGAAIGGALVGWSLGAAIASDDDPSWVPAAIGGGVLAVSFPCAIAAGNKLENAVDAHNRLVTERGRTR